jgi:methyl-accepting chemotaxis protein
MIAVIVMCGVYLLFTVVINKPLAGITRAMAALSGGRLDILIPAARRSDEIGQMVASLQIFQSALQEAEQLRITQAEERARAESEKVAALRLMAETVEMETRAAVDQVAALTSRMADNAKGMAESAASVGDNSQNVAAAASEANANAQTVAVSAEKLSASIREIAAQVENASQITGTAVVASDHAQVTVEQLSAAVGRIGEVATLINNIAAQTNLLALNATIEAARAGEAGKGFAVVANEVKNLASQTARATSEITAQIAEIQSTTTDAVQSMGEISGAITEVRGVAAAVAASIQEQGAATHEIARNVVQTTRAAREVAERIAHVSDEASSTGERAERVGRISAEVSGGIDRLREVLVRVVRTSTKEVNRRRKPRYRIMQPGTVSVAGISHSVVIENISEGGLMVSGLTASISSGTRVTVSIPGVAGIVTAVVLLSDRGRLHGKFELAPEATELWYAECARLIDGLEPMREAA